MAIYQNGRYVVTGNSGLYKTPKNYPHPAYRVVNVETRKIASPEFRNLKDALFHADSLVASHVFGRRKE